MELTEEKVHEALVAAIPQISNMIDSDYASVHQEIVRNLGDNEGAKTKYTYAINAVIVVDMSKSEIGVDLKSQWDMKKFGRNSAKVDPILLNALPGAGDDFGKNDDSTGDGGDSE